MPALLKYPLQSKVLAIRSGLQYNLVLWFGMFWEERAFLFRVKIPAPLDIHIYTNYNV